MVLTGGAVRLPVQTRDEFEASLLDEETCEFSASEPERGGWAHLEIKGQASHYGYVRELTLFGATMVEVLVPFFDKPGVRARYFYAGSAVFSCTPTSRTVCKGANRPPGCETEQAPKIQPTSGDGPKLKSPVIVMHKDCADFGRTGTVDGVFHGYSFRVKFGDGGRGTVRDDGCVLYPWSDWGVVVGPVTNCSCAMRHAGPCGPNLASETAKTAEVT